VPETVVERVIRRQTWTEPLSDWVQKVVGGAYRALGPVGPPLKSLLNGTYLLRHPLHPTLSDVPVGAWTVGVVADFAAHFTARIPEAAGDVALAVGLAVALLTLLTGYTDFFETVGTERRFGCIHGLFMSVVVVFFTTSLALRWWGGEGVHPLAVGLSTTGYALLVLGAWIGGHLVLGKGTTVNRHAFSEGPEGPVDWAAVGPASEVPATGTHLVDAGGMRFFLTRVDGRICGLAAVCSHAGGPLYEGAIDKGVIACPWHGSRFRLRDGHTVGGPATFDQPCLDVREVDGRLEVKLTEPLR